MQSISVQPDVRQSKKKCTLLIPSAVIALLIVLGCLSLPAQAGYYQMISQTGGTFQMVPGPPSPINYANSTQGYGSGGGEGGSVTCSGTITTVFQWQSSGPSDTPPQNVIVKETCSASWGGYGIQLPAGACNNGLGDADVDMGPMPNAPGPPMVSTSHISTGTHYRVVQGQATLTFTCTPSANSADQVYAYCNVWYSVAPTAVIVNLQGVTDNGSRNILIGQGITANLDTGAYHQTTWTWTISGDPFAGFQLGPGNQTGHAIELAPGALTQASVSYFYRSIGTPGVQPPQGETSNAQTVTCISTVTDPNNANAPPIQVTGSTSVNVYQPFHDITISLGALDVYLHVDGTIWFQAAGNGILGITWQGHVITPAMFIQEQGVGSWNYTQLIRPDISYVANGVSHNDPNNGKKGLDGTFPYAGPYMADNSLGKAGDSPGKQVNDTMSRIDYNLNAWTWMLYRPPSFDSVSPTTWVPLHEVDWSVGGSATHDADGWHKNVFGNGIIVNDRGPMSVLPDWTQIITAIPF